MFDAVAYINEPRWHHVSLGLERVRALLAKLGNPQNKFASVHVAGTNGKGSTCAYLSNILICAGYKTGLFTSPFVHNFEERICINGEEITSEDLLSATLLVRDAATSVEQECGEHPTEFELMFAVACVHFSTMQCDVCVIEVGLGGRLDATNVINPIACVITPISLDHTALLGDSIEEIAKEKAGIIKLDTPVISAPQQMKCLEVIERTCAKLNAPLKIVDYSEISDEAIDMSSCNQSFYYEGRKFSTSLLGAYQPKNAALAISAAKKLSQLCKFYVSDSSIKEGIAQTRWEGRFELISKNPLVIVDGAHNPHGAKGCAQTISALKLCDVSLVMGAMADKDVLSILGALREVSSCIYTYTADNPRAETAQNLANYAAANGFKARAFDSPKEAIYFAHKERPEHPIVALGSLYSIAAVKQAVYELF